ncbi:arylsulfatase [Paraflavisolibacter sp. H34]|uniref:arylsulfatase n=1 Tax=Huijunlia imazamoxiresistens TaxID=3127457 RepID=UPI00301928D6
MKKVLLFSLLALSLVSTRAQKAKRPNIIVIVADDMGYSDLGAFGSEIKTPNLDRLATGGLRLREFYNNAICAPTRASLLTGQYPHKAGIGYFDVNLGLPAYQGFLNNESLTLAEVLKGAGYSTLLSGKWHVGNDSLSWPNQRGFDRSYGVIGGGANYFDADPMPIGNGAYPVVLQENNKRLHPEPGSYYFTDEITKHAVSYLDEQNSTGKPFFLYVAYNAPHWPLQALPEDIAKYKGKYDIGWDSLRSQRLARQRELGILRPGSAIAPKDETIPAWNVMTYDEKDFWKKRMEIYAAMVDRMDQGIGKILEKVKELQKDENTLVVFFSDNGGQGGSYDPYHKQASRTTGPIGTAGSFDYVYKNWAYVSNTPLRSYKGDMHEGGISAPFIAWYPSLIKGGSIGQGSAHLIDLAPTLYELAGARYPAKNKGVNVNPLPGQSLVPLFRDAAFEREQPIFWERAGNRAVRKGKWKIVSSYPNYKWELYDIEADRGETTDLAARNPGVVNELSTAYAQWADRTGVVEYSKLAPRAATALPVRIRD